MHFKILAICLFCSASRCRSAEVVQVTWQTQKAAPAVQFTRPLADFLGPFRLAMQVLPESSIVALALSQPAMLGLTDAQAAVMRPRVAERYALISTSPVYSRVTTALPYCFAEKQPSYGLARVHVPDGMSAQTEVLVFLHGYGGSFLWYQHLLAERFPHHLIVCPVHGINTALVSPDYIQECLAAVSSRLHRSIEKPTLVGLSAGGTGVCQLYTSHPERFGQMICLASYPPTDLLTKFPRHGKILFVAGAKEFFVASGDFMRRIRSVHLEVPGTQGFIVPDADHFFLLTHTDVTTSRLQAFLAPP